MRNTIDFSSWQGILSTLFGLVLVTLVAVGIRLAVMQRVQMRRERANRQINERLKTLIAAYKTLGGSFTGTLAVDPLHLKDARALAEAEDTQHADSPGAERRRRIRDAVETALSDVVLLGTEEQVCMASTLANRMVEGRRIETSELVVSLRNFIREVLDLAPIPAGMAIPDQGPLRAAASRAGRAEGGGSGGARGGGGGGGGAGGAGLGAGVGLAGAGMASHDDANEANDLPGTPQGGP